MEVTTSRAVPPAIFTPVRRRAQRYLGLARDFVRLHFRCWTARPDLRDAFFDGYGRNLTEVDQQAICHCGAIDVLTALVRGRQTGDATMTAHGRQTLRQLQQRD